MTRETLKKAKQIEKDIKTLDEISEIINCNNPYASFYYIGEAEVSLERVDPETRNMIIKSINKILLERAEALSKELEEL